MPRGTQKLHPLPMVLQVLDRVHDRITLPIPIDKPFVQHRCRQPCHHRRKHDEYGGDPRVRQPSRAYRHGEDGEERYTKGGQLLLHALLGEAVAGRPSLNGCGDRRAAEFFGYVDRTRSVGRGRLNRKGGFQAEVIRVGVVLAGNVVREDYLALGSAKDGECGSGSSRSVELRGLAIENVVETFPPPGNPALPSRPAIVEVVGGDAELLDGFEVGCGGDGLGIGVRDDPGVSEGSVILDNGHWEGRGYTVEVSKLL